MPGRNFTKGFVLNYTTYHTTQGSSGAEVNTTGYDMKDYNSIVGVLRLSSAASDSPGAAACSTAVFIKAGGSATQSTSVSDAYVDLEGTAVAYTTGSDNTLICEVHKPMQRFIRFEILGSSAQGFAECFVVRGKARSMPVSSVTGQQVELHVSPSTGTA
jgi:hypothetical protein